MKPRYLLDVNVPIAVLRRDSPHHESATSWLRDALERGAEVVVLAETLTAAVRLVSNSRAWRQPTPADRAVEALNQLVALTDARVIGAGLEAWREFTRIAKDVSLTTRMVPDALLASVAIAQGATVVTFDRGLADYPGVRATVLTSE